MIKKKGRTFEYNEEGKIITIFEYNKDRLINRELINRIDENGDKQGIWKEFYEDSKVNIEKGYKDNKLEGYYKNC